MSWNTVDRVEFVEDFDLAAALDAESFEAHYGDEIDDNAGPVLGYWTEGEFPLRWIEFEESNIDQ